MPSALQAQNTKTPPKNIWQFPTDINGGDMTLAYLSVKKLLGQEFIAIQGLEIPVLKPVRK
jgi:hypothetical protein